MFAYMYELYMYSLGDLWYRFATSCPYPHTHTHIQLNSVSGPNLWLHWEIFNPQILVNCLSQTRILKSAHVRAHIIHSQRSRNQTFTTRNGR